MLPSGLWTSPGTNNYSYTPLAGTELVLGVLQDLGVCFQRVGLISFNTRFPLISSWLLVKHFFHAFLFKAHGDPEQ